MKIESTAQIVVPPKLVDQVIGQDKAVEIVKKAARQKRHVLLIGPPGTGKSMLAQAMAELMEGEELEDVLVYPNGNNENQPLVRVVKSFPDFDYLKRNGLIRFYTPVELEKIKKLKKSELPSAIRVGLGRRIAFQKQEEDQRSAPSLAILAIITVILLYVGLFSTLSDSVKWFVMLTVLGVGLLYIISNATAGLGRRLVPKESNGPKLVIDNSEKMTAPFVDATGSRAGSLLGDVKHDPLQCFFPSSSIICSSNAGKDQIRTLESVIDELLGKYPEFIGKDDKYEGLILPEREKLYTLGFKDGKSQLIRINCVNRRKHSGKLYSVGPTGSRLLLTPEHKIYVNGSYIAASAVPENSGFMQQDALIIDRTHIINTFSKEDQKSAVGYLKFLELKKQNPSWGYKRIAKVLGIKSGQVRWWNNCIAKPKAIKSVERLENIGLLPFSINHKAAPLAARVLGTTFGDGGIFSTLNAIFLSSSEEDSLNQYAQDLISLFGERISTKFIRRISGINDTGMSAWNTDRDVVRFFVALGAPIGRKNKEISLPQWIHFSSETEKEFFGALLGNELCSPKYSEKQNKLNCFAVGFAGDFSLKQNRHMLLRRIATFLNSYGIKTSENINQNEFRKGRFVWRLIISSEIDSLMRFYQFIPVRYSNKKLERIRKSIDDVLERKKQKSQEFLGLNKSDKYIHSTLRVSANMLQKIVMGQKISFNENSVDYSGYVYNVTTESGNVFVNGILAANSGGLGTSPHLRVEAGAIHQANKGVLFIDEIASLKMNWQQEILTAMQEKKYPITGQSEMSSGALVKTQPVPADFVLVAAGNLPDIDHIHPALRSRIRGAGYEVYVEEYLEDTPENQEKLVRFIAQEVKRDGRIPHFDSSGIEEVVEEARRMSGRRMKFALNLRELGGLIRAAGDVARERNLPLVTRAEVIESKKYFRSIESQFGEKMIERKKEYQTIITIGAEIGRVNGLAVLGDSRTGLVLPIVAEATPAASRSEGRVIATGKLGTIAKEAVDNVSALFKKYIGTEIFRTDLHIQYLQTYEGLEGDSASISTALAVISAISHIPVYQSVAMTGSLDVRGQVLPVGGVTGKIEAAIEAGIKKVLIPKSNAQDIYLSKENVKKIEIIEVSGIYEVLDHALQEGIRKKELLRKIKRQSEN